MPVKGPFRRVYRRIDGRFRKVWESMHPASIGLRAVRYAAEDLGYTEDPPGSNLTKYGKHWGQDGVPWCGMAVGVWWKKAGFLIPRSLALQIDYVPALIDLARRKQHRLSIVHWKRARAGDAVCFDFDGGVADHVGLFERWIDKRRGVFTSLEGNTSSSSNANGGRVERRVRRLNQVAAFVRKLPN